MEKKRSLNSRSGKRTAKPKKKLQREAYWNKKELKGRGWTDGLIKTFLGKANATQENSFHRTGPPIQLFRRERVEAAERTTEFLEALAQLEPRRANLRSAAERKRAEMQRYVDELKIEVPEIEWDDLVARSVKHFESREADQGRDSWANPADSASIELHCVNYLRHEMTDYDRKLDEIRKAVGADEARIAIKERVLDAIAEKYPNLMRECTRQRNVANHKADSRLFGRN